MLHTPGGLRRLSICVLAAAALAAGRAPADELRIPAVSTAFRGRQLTAEARLVPILSPEFAQRLASGLPTATTWEIRLLASRNLWFDGLKDERRYEVTASFRPVNSDWMVESRLDGKLLETHVVSTLAEAADALAHLPPFPVFRMGDHLLGKRLVVKVRCTYASGISLGVIPTSTDTGWTRSSVFVWNGEAP